jgi:pimeloyl-ACP methyl ester carboxylesterase
VPAETASLPGVDIHHIDAGPKSREAVLLVHGLTATHRYWKANVEHLSRKRRVLAPDLPGFGRSSKPDASYDIDYFVDALARLLDHKGVDRVALVGNSMGGHVAMSFVLQHPDRVQRLVLVDSAGVSRMPPLVAGPSAKALSLALARLPSRMPRVPKAFVVMLFKAVFPGRDDLADRYIRAYQRGIASDEYALYLRAVMRSIGGILAAPMHERAREIRIPTLIMWGARDRLLSVSAGRRLRRTIPDARLLVYDESGHCPMVDQPDRWNRDVEAFLDGAEVGA